MTWLNPWAWLGLVAIGVPIAIHFLTRAQPRPQPFPTLRFLAVSQTTAMRRRALRDRALLAVRAGILAAVVAALAQPYLRTALRQHVGAATLSRAIVIDTSASLNRTTADGRTAISVARTQADAVQPAAAATVRIDARRIRDGVMQATTWLAARGGRDELVVVSDFHRGAMTNADLAAVPATIGVRLIKVDAVANPSPAGSPDQIGDGVWTPHLTLESEKTSVMWTPASGAPAPPIRVLAGPNDAGQVAAAIAASQAIGTPAEAPTHPISVMLPDAADRASMLATAGAIDAPWMFDAITRIGSDAAIKAAALRIIATPVTATITGATVIARDASSTPLLVAFRSPAAAGTASAVGNSASELVLLAQSDDDLFISALVTAARVTARDPTAIRELEPVSIPPAELAAWQRPTPETGSPAPDARDASDGRWFWLAALVLFGVEGWMRRSPAASADSEVTDARVA
jgi:hypothetical protein